LHPLLHRHHPVFPIHIHILRIPPILPQSCDVRNIVLKKCIFENTDAYMEGDFYVFAEREGGGRLIRRAGVLDRRTRVLVEWGHAKSI
ncbi:MAG: hypothetical protein FWF84_07080, partial [Kiritimatiellaeota bacterium]|nr:hypothetical protein [Kiritimatiellota bacterium]